jgi:Cu+-exporting ATPase
VTEDKGIGVNATDEEGNLYSVGSYTMAKHVTNDKNHTIYVLKNNNLIATLDLEDEIKPGAKETITRLKEKGIKTVLLSGDRKEVCMQVAEAIGIDEVYSEQLPHQKLEIIEKFSKAGMTAMVGDGINDAPALSRADVGVSLSDASQVAIQSADIVILQSNQLTNLLKARGLTHHTLLTIKQNLFWAFFYNVLAIPVAAAGYLSPAIAALSMAFSDLVLIGNSVRLRFKKIAFT